MNRTMLTMALAMALLAISPANISAKTKQKKTVTVYCSTQFQGSEVKPVKLPMNKKGFVEIFNGTTLDGWRGYGKDHVPAGWTIEEGCLKFTPGSEGGDIIFAHDYQNFELELEWKISEGGNSGLFYLAQETKAVNSEGIDEIQPIYISCPEYQLLDNENHPDAKLGVDGNRKSASLYDMLPAKPQNAKPFGQWNKAKVVVKNGKVTHYQNGKKVLSFTLWTPEWTEMIQNSKFSEKNWPIAYKTMVNCGGEKHAGVIGFQDHGNVIWIRDVKVKEL